MLKRALFSLLPTPVRIQGRSFAWNYFLDVWDQLRGRTERVIPPRHLNIAGRGSFLALGEHNVRLCRSLGGLRSDDKVLDVGCGIGRTATALAKFLTPPGSYAGFDVIEFAIDWCRRHIAKEHSHFRFVHCDVRNVFYNPRGAIEPEKFVFPFEPEEFTFCLATSVFTHLLPPTAEHYAKEVARTVRPGGRFLSTWFLLDDLTEAAYAAGKWSLQFPHRFAKHAQESIAAPEQAVAYQRAYVEDVFLNAGFKITSMRHGGWSGAAADVDSGQDVIAAERA